MSVETAVVLAAGEGTRLRPLTENRPKPMLPAANRPVLEHVFDAVIDAGVTDLHVVVGYGRDRVQGRVGATYRGVPVHYHRQATRLGSGHALSCVAEAVSGNFLVVYGDQVVESQMVEEVATAQNADGSATAMAVVESDAASEYGAVRLFDDRVVELVERPKTDDYRMLNAGVYALDDGIFDALERTDRVDGEIPLTRTLADRIDDTFIRGVVSDAAWVDATYPWDLLAVARSVLSAGDVPEPERAPGVYVSPDARVDDAAVLCGPVVVSADCEVGPGAVVGPDTALGWNVTVGPNATVEGSVLDADVRVGPGATLVDTVAGEAVRVGSGAVVLGGPGDVRVGDRVHRDERLGAVFADRATLGGAASAGPGTLVGPRAVVDDGVHVDGVVDGGASVSR